MHEAFDNCGIGCFSNHCLSNYLGDGAADRNPAFAACQSCTNRCTDDAMPFVYVLMTKSPAKRILTYVGWTLDLERRLAEHNNGNRGAKSTRGRAWHLVYAEKHRTRRSAMKREYTLKRDRAFRALLRNP